MKKTIVSLFAAVAVTVFSTGAALAQEVIIANGCDFPLYGLALVHTGEDEGNNLITAPLAPGDGIRVELNVSKAIDLMAEDEEGTVITFTDLDLSGASMITLHNDGTASIE